MMRRPPRSTPLYSSAASDVYKRQVRVAPPPRIPPVPWARIGSRIGFNIHALAGTDREVNDEISRRRIIRVGKAFIRQLRPNGIAGAFDHEWITGAIVLTGHPRKRVITRKRRVAVEITAHPQ